MERKINKLENSHVEVIVTVDKETWEKEQKAAFKKVADKVQVPGFRKGKAPENLIKGKVNQVEVMNTAIDTILPKIYKDIINEDKIVPFTQPKVDVTKISDTELEVKFVIVTEPDLELGNYKNIEIGKEEVKLTKEEKEAAINEVLDKNASLVVKEDVAANGDTVVIDFKGSVDGKFFEGGSADNYELVLGSNSFIPGFEAQLVGHKAGEHVDVNVTFPEQYTEELKGKAAVFACDIHEVKTKKLPELNDEFVKEQNIPNVNTVDELKAHVEGQKKAQKEQQAKSAYFEKLLAKIAEGCKASIPDEIVEQQANSRKEDFTKRMTQSGLNMEQYLSILGKTEEELNDSFKEQAKKELINYLILEKVAKAEKMDEVTDADLEFEYSKLAEQYKMSIEDVKKALEQNIDSFTNNVKMNRVETFLYNSNK